MKVIYDREVESAFERDFPEPVWSAIVEMHLRKSLKAYKIEDKRDQFQ